MQQDVKEKIKCTDVTYELLSYINDSPKNIGEKYEYVYTDKNGNKIVYNRTNAKFDKKGPKSDEMKTINYLRDKFGFNINIIHRINIPVGISCPDIEISFSFKSEYWEIKNIYKSKTENSKRSKLKHRISKQCSNFIFDLTNKECDLTNEEAIEQVFIIFNDFQYRHVNKIMLIGNNDFIKVYFRK